MTGLTLLPVPLFTYTPVLKVQDHYLTIQQAIDAAQPGDTVLIAEGTYYEHLTITKSISLVGSNRNTIIDGGGSGTVIYVSASNVDLTGLTVRNSSIAYMCSGILLDGCTDINVADNSIRDFCGYGVLLKDSHRCSVVNNSVVNNDYGITIENSFNNTITGNTLYRNRYGIETLYSRDNTVTSNNISGYFQGIYISCSSGNYLRNNKLSDSIFNFGVTGESLSDFMNDVDTSNTVNDRPIYYWINEHDKSIPSDAAYVIVVNSTRITLTNLTLTNNWQGAVLAFTNDSLVQGIRVSRNAYGVKLECSNGNEIVGVSATENEYHGISVHKSDSNTFSDNVISSTVISSMVGFYLGSSNRSRITNNTVESIEVGVALVDSHQSLVLENTLMDSVDRALILCRSAYNVIVRNRINSSFIGMELMEPATNSNTIQENTFKSNRQGIRPCWASGNIFYHNNVVNNTEQVLVVQSHNLWDNGVEGNFWSGYNGTDMNYDGIGDTPYAIDQANKDQYPLMEPYATAPPAIQSDLNRDGIVDIYDSLRACNAFGTCPGSLDYDINIDANQDLTIDIFDMIILASNFGKTSSGQTP